MKHTNLLLLGAIFFDQTGTKKFLIGVWVGLAFSISVILSTVGIMDGFERTLRHGLKKSSGDISMQSRNGFFDVDQEMKEKFRKNNIQDYAKIVQVDSFLIFNEESRGVLVRGIDSFYGDVIQESFNLSANSVAIGQEIARINKIKKGDFVVLAFGRGSDEFRNMPTLSRFRVEKIVSHGIYQKDLRMVYVRLPEIQQILFLSERINMLTFNLGNAPDETSDDLKKIEKKVMELKKDFNSDFYFKPYWKEYSSFLEAVKVEKFLISVILQIIVVIAVFNVLGFIYFINEKKIKELFLFQALGLSKKAMNRLWIKFVVLLWLASSVLSIAFVQFFRFLLMHLSFFKLPAEIYHMPRIDLFLSWEDYVLVFFLALLWILLITYYLLRRLKNKNLLEGLRQEFA